MPAEDLSLIANFDMAVFTLTLIANPEVGGTVRGLLEKYAGDIFYIIANPNIVW